MVPLMGRNFGEGLVVVIKEGGHALRLKVDGKPNINRII